MGREGGKGSVTEEWVGKGGEGWEVGREKSEIEQ